MTNSKAVPFVKWVGGKRQLLPQIKCRMPRCFNKYIEPFVGGGAVYFELQPEQAIINDINRALINVYNYIKRSPHQFIDAVNEYDYGILNNGKEYYYQVREHYNNKIINSEYDLDLAALFVFLNKHCFNGLYRVNKNGLFNVPYNNSVCKSYFSEAIIAASEVLQKSTILNDDFEMVCGLAEQGDFIFIDSPYAPLNPTSFESYTKEGFSIEEHIRLSEIYRKLDDKGCYCMLTNHNTEFINKLYDDFKIEVVDVRRMINSDAKNRVGKEVIITNYEI